MVPEILIHYLIQFIILDIIQIIENPEQISEYKKLIIQVLDLLLKV